MSGMGFDRDGHLTELGLSRLLYEGDVVAAAHVEGCTTCATVAAEMRAEDAASMIPLPDQKPKRSVNRSQIAGTLAFVTVVGVIFLVVRSQTELFVGAAPGIRARGGAEVDLTVHVHDGRESRVVAPGAVVRPGDKARFEVLVGKPGFVMVVGMDERGEQYACWPQEDNPAAMKMEASDKPVVSPTAVEFDETPGDEHLFALWCDHPFMLSDLAPSVTASVFAAPATAPVGCTMTRVDLRKVGR